jgi:PAS domain S-box-containing protein
MPERSEFVLEPLREGADFTLYRGQQRGNHAPVLAVVLAAEQPSPQSVLRLRHEYALATELDAAWAAKPLALTRHEGRIALILKDPGGEPLDRILEQNQGQPLDLTRVLRIAIGLAAALGQVHLRGLIHKDIKPANVLVDGDDNVWLTGFGIASELPHERQAPAPPEIIAGTLAYMAPEQTGRMNRSVDARSDLYSLGVTLYQMLTGRRPFEATDPLEWVHCHIARQQTPPGEYAAVPEPLSAIDMKLLAKNAEERYQTAFGVEADLRTCLAEWELHGRIDGFQLGAHDSPDRLLIPEKLYGREREIDALLAAFDRVLAQGTAELVLVSGYSGIGKSSVVNELHRVLVPRRGFFASGKFDQYKRDIPYATLAQAFQTLIRQILVKSETEVEQWRSAILEAVGPNGQLIENVIPEVEFILGKQPPVPDLPTRDAQNRFQLVFRRFLGVFARPEHPLVLFLDDLQWLDAASLELLENLVTRSEVQYLLLVGAYRDNEVGPAHPLIRTFDAIRKTGTRIEEIVLAPLGLDNFGRLFADALHCDSERSRPLAELVQERTGGNPLFAIQFLTSLAEDGLLAFDAATRDWQWEMNCIRSKSYTDNVVDLMSGRLRRLSALSREALKRLACLGNAADVATLVLLHGETEETIHAEFKEAVRAGLIFPENGSYKFLHDRIQEAAYSLIPEEQRANIHLDIARVLLASLTSDQLAVPLFDVANQFNRGAGLLLDKDEKVQVATINLRVGRKAKASAAYASACAYLEAGMALLDGTDWSSQYELMFGLWLECAECEYLCGNFENAERLITVLLQRGASKIDLAAIQSLKVLFHIMKSEHQQAVASALACLRLFGIDLPAHPTWEQVQTEYEAIWQFLDGRPIESLIDLPLMSDPELQAAMRVLFAFAPSALHTDFCLFCIRACRVVRISMQHGMSGACAHAYGSLGSSVVAPVFHRYRDAHRFAKLACDLVEKHGFIAYQARVQSTMGRVAFWTQPLATVIDFMRMTSRGAIETGDLTLACYALAHCITALLLRNDPLDTVWRESEMALDFAREVKYGDAEDIIRSQQRFIATMQDRTATISTFSDAEFDEATFETQLIRHRLDHTNCLYRILKLKMRFLTGNYTGALAAADKVEPLPSFAIGQIELLDYYYYSALTVAALYENALAGEKTKWQELLTAHREQLREWAENYPPTFADKHALVSAEIARIEGRDGDAMRLYEQAIRLARVNGFVQNEALALEVSAQFYLARGVETIADTYLRNARNCYDRWGAHGKVKQLDALYPQLRNERHPASNTSTIGALVRQLDVETVVKSSQALSSEIFLTKLIENLMRIAVEHAGAERGLLVLLRGGEPRIEAEASTGHGKVEVIARQAAVTPSDLLQSALHYAIRTRESVVVDDASVTNLYPEDEYVREKRPRSVLCLPIVKQTKLVGALYLENNLTPRAFTSDRVAVLEMLASQAAISIENATLFSDLQRSEAHLAQSEMELRQILDFAPQQVRVLAIDRTCLYVNQASLDYLGVTLDEFQSLDHRNSVHPDDWERMMSEAHIKFQSGVPHEAELRLRRKDGKYRWFLFRYNPLRDELGCLRRWYVAGTDIEDRKQAEQRLQSENVALREEINRASMFEEIVGTSPALRTVLSLVSKVAPTDSTVLITGETGTGKELIARAVHKRSQRSSGAFVSVNCAAIPRDLIASELFGHEKGAFTGALQRRLGRFELAEGGTIFLDEIGELPAETQIALLRVLQEHEFERVGGTGTIRTNVRVIAATNRELQAAIASGTFRSDLFYRLNVFPIEVPALRERREDLPVLVAYFIDRFARKAGKSIRSVDKKSLELLQAYPWPGNIRELQNVIERSVIVCDTECFSVDESWLSRQPSRSEPKRGPEEAWPELSRKLASHEKEMIEAALRESRGRVSGPSGAAVKLGIPGSTLDSKIRSLRIDKNRFKSIYPSTDRS